jgi:hypothetical protein
MKRIIILIISIFFAFSISQAQEAKEADFRVEGVCGMCQMRIENAALIKGVKSATWNRETHMLNVVYNEKKTKVLDIHKAVAKAGHSTEMVQAADEDYKKLPACCAYQDGVKDH